LVIGLVIIFSFSKATARALAPLLPYGDGKGFP
jgi:hypothetical protein